jgi:hypothetical protein
VGNAKAFAAVLAMKGASRNQAGSLGAGCVGTVALAEVEKRLVWSYQLAVNVSLGFQIHISSNNDVDKTLTGRNQLLRAGMHLYGRGVGGVGAVGPTCSATAVSDVAVSLQSSSAEVEECCYSIPVVPRTNKLGDIRVKST